MKIFNKKILLINTSYTVKKYAIVIILFFVLLGANQVAFAIKNVKSKKAVPAKQSYLDTRNKKITSKKQKSNKKSKNAIAVEDKKRQLEDINKSISQTQSQINTLKKQEKSTLNKLYTYQQQSSEIKQNINVLNQQINALFASINNIEKEYAIIDSRLNNAQSAFAVFSKKTYVENNNNKNKFSSAYDIRNDIYSQFVTKRMNNTACVLTVVKDSLVGQSNSLRDKSNKEAELKKQKEQENQKINKTINSNKNSLEKIRNDKQLLAKELASKQKSAKQLTSIISRLIETERKAAEQQRKENAKRSNNKKSNNITQEKSTKSSTKENNSSKRNRTSSKEPEASLPEIITPRYNPSGRFSWPSSSRSILRKYGSYRNQQTGTVFDNPGVDISARSGSSVIASAPGKVSLVHWLPGYGSLVIVNHGDGMRTVYANLSSVNVKQGEMLTAGKLIGRSGESVDGEFLHFEVWNGTRRLNPLNYLR